MREHQEKVNNLNLYVKYERNSLVLNQKVEQYNLENKQYRKLTVVCSKTAQKCTIKIY
jgi:hypothetical protein